MFVYLYSDDSDSSDDEIPPPPPPKSTKQTEINNTVNLNTSITSNNNNNNNLMMKDKLSFDPNIPNDNRLSNTNIPNIVAYKRIFDNQYNRYYYVSLITNESQWNVPTDGIVECK